MSKPKLDEQSSHAKNIKIPLEVLNELLTPSEARMLKNRWQILKLLEDGLSIRQVAKEAKVGTDTVVRVARMSDKNSLRKALDKNRELNIKPKTPWIFGKSE
ncbi:hypothetical protein HY386_00675 [Candidatus Daviesbacteria bacterium]|nr:hypothetical protein [Candidatus Daviesbacteria bacterium]